VDRHPTKRKTTTYSSKRQKGEKESRRRICAEGREWGSVGGILPAMGEGVKGG